MSQQFDNNTIIKNFSKEELIESYNRLISYNNMAKEFGCSKSTIAKYMKKHNIFIN